MDETNDTREALEEPLLTPDAKIEGDTAVPTAESCDDAESVSGHSSSAPQEQLTEEQPYNYKGPLLLVFVAFLYGTLNISLRSLYLMPKPPAPSVLSTARGWLSVFFFVPFLLHRRLRSRSTRNESDRDTTHEGVLPDDAEAASAGLENPEEPRSSSLPDDSSSSSLDNCGRRAMCWAAAELALWNSMSQAFFNFGLVTTPSARASFLGQTTVVMVPLLSTFLGERLRYWDALGCLLSLIGLILLAQEASTSPHPDPPTWLWLHSFENTESTSFVPTLRIGDLSILGGALTWSLYLLRNSKFAPLYDEVYLQATKNVVLAILYSSWWFAAASKSHHTLWEGWKNPLSWLILIYSALGPGTIADLLQQKGQESVGATESNLILCVESVFTALLSRLLLGEETEWIEKLGGAFLIAGAMASSVQ